MSAGFKIKEIKGIGHYLSPYLLKYHQSISFLQPNVKWSVIGPIYPQVAPKKSPKSSARDVNYTTLDPSKNFRLRVQFPTAKDDHRYIRFSIWFLSEPWGPLRNLLDPIEVKLIQITWNFWNNFLMICGLRWFTMSFFPRRSSTNSSTLIAWKTAHPNGYDEKSKGGNHGTTGPLEMI